MKPKIILALSKKEFFGYINSALAYTVLVPFLLLSIFLYTQTALVGNQANLRPYFELLPWFLLLLAPALSMKLLTDEQRSLTIELLFAHPLSETEIVLGKFFGALTFFVLILATTLGLPLTLIIYSRPDLGQIIGQYIGALFIGATFLSIGLTSSAYVKNAISSFLLSAAVSFLFIIIGLDFVTLMLPPPFNRLAGELSVLTHVENIARGLLDIRDVFYFLSLTGVFLTASIIKLSERKTSESPKETKKLQLALGLILIIGILSNIILSALPLRVDLTKARLFTLSEGTKQTLKNLDDILTITLYASRDLPAQMQLVARDITDLLADYQKLGKNVKIRMLHPEENSDVSQEAQSVGIREVQFNRIAAGKFEVQAGVLGIALRFADKSDSIPFISDTSDLEYQLTRRIRKLAGSKEIKIGLYKNGFSQNQILTELLSTQYQTENLAVDDMEKLKGLSALIVIDDGSEVSTASALIKNYLDRNGKMLLLANGITVNPQSLTAQKSQSTIPAFLTDYGVTLNSDLVYDLELSEILALNGECGQRYLTQYPYWFRSLPAATDFAPATSIKSISMGWPSSLTITKKEGISVKTLLTTGLNAGKSIDSFDISPESIRSLAPSSRENIPLSVLVEKGDLRLVVVGSTTLADDQFLQDNRDNIAFLSNTIDYLAADKDLAAIPAKSSGRAVFEFRSPLDLILVQYGNLLIPPVLVSLFAVFYLRRRTRLTQRTYVQQKS